MGEAVAGLGTAPSEDTDPDDPVFSGDDEPVTDLDRAITIVSYLTTDFLGTRGCDGPCTGGLPGGTEDGRSSRLMQAIYLGVALAGLAGTSMDILDMADGPAIPGRATITSGDDAIGGGSVPAGVASGGGARPTFGNLGDDAAGTVLGTATRGRGGYRIGGQLAEGSLDFVVQDGRLIVGHGHAALSGGGRVSYAPSTRSTCRTSICGSRASSATRAFLSTTTRPRERSADRWSGARITTGRSHVGEPMSPRSSTR